MNGDFSADFAAVADGLEPVTLVPCGGAAVAIGHALRGTIGTREAAASDGAYTASDVRWQFPAAECSQQPQLGDVLVDAAGGRWTVLQVQRGTQSARWICACRNMAVAHRLDDLITIERADYAKGTGGAAEPVWSAWQSGVWARIQPAAAEVTAEHHAQLTLTRYQIFLAEELPLDRTYRICAADGTYYQIVGVTKAQRIGELQTVLAEQRT